jgi:Ca2+-binding EF-hand superfamily protein
MLNNLKVKFSIDQISKLYDHFKLDWNVRSEELTYEEIENIYLYLKEQCNV